MAMVIPAAATARPVINPVISNNTYTHTYHSSDKTTTTTTTQNYTQNNNHSYTIEICVISIGFVISIILAWLIADIVENRYSRK